MYQQNCRCYLLVLMVIVHILMCTKAFGQAVGDPIPQPKSIGKTKILLSAKSQKQMGEGFWRPKTEARIQDGWKVKSNFLSLIGYKDTNIRIQYVRIEDKQALLDIMSPPNLMQTSYRRLSGNGWNGFVERDSDSKQGIDSVKVILTQDNRALLLYVSWPTRSQAARTACDEAVRSIVWSLAEVGP